jgi:hypothetical protein
LFLLRFNKITLSVDTIFKIIDNMIFTDPETCKYTSETVQETNRTVQKAYRTVKEPYRTVQKAYRTVQSVLAR